MHILVVKRSFVGTDGERDAIGKVARSVTNHDEMMDALQKAFPEEVFVEFARVTDPSDIGTLDVFACMLNSCLPLLQLPCRHCYIGLFVSASRSNSS